MEGVFVFSLIRALGSNYACTYPNSGLNERYLCWDEENRLSATRDNNYVTANIYDASGNRAWKIAGEMNWMWQNGSGWQGYGDLNLRTWYQSELMTITDVGFTKHYFIAGQKIASKLGEGFRNSDELHPLKGAPLEPIYSDYTELARAQVNRLQRDFDCLGVSYGNFNPGEGNIRLLDDYEVIEIGEESDIYFYHSDHLGSSSFLTDGGGVATQHLQYMPFGEDLVHQQNTAAYYTPYTFSGKERDMETGLSYFGARYYDAGLSIWLSVDPMADKLPSLSSYNYCAWNPVILKDPDGNLPWLIGAVVGAVSEVAAQIAVNKVTGQKWNKFDYADIAASTIAGAISGGLSSLTKINKARKVGIALTQAAQIGVSSAVDAVANENGQGVDVSMWGAEALSLSSGGLIIDVKGKKTEEVAAEAAFGGLSAGVKKFISGALNEDIAKKADDLMKNRSGSRGNPEIKKLENTAMQHDAAAEAVTNWWGKYTVEEVKGLMNND
jgi:RHS repeat-associated protein